MSNLYQNPARIAAEEDFDPTLVDIDDEVLKGLPTPSGLKGGMGATVDGVLGSQPELFIPYFVAMTALNFQFWDVTSAGEFIRYERDGKVGAQGMTASFQAVWTELLEQSMAQLPSATPAVHSAAVISALRTLLQHQGVEFIFGDIPSAGVRREILLEVLQPQALYDWSALLARRCAESGRLDWTVAAELASLFPKAYGDRYLKKAQLLLMFVAGQWAKTPGQTIHLDVSAAADYQLPRVMRGNKLLTYSEGLARTVDAGQLIPSGSKEERAIRAATIIACDRLASHFGATVEEVDYWLWLNRNADKSALFHRTLTSNY